MFSIINFSEPGFLLAVIVHVFVCIFLLLATLFLTRRTSPGITMKVRTFTATLLLCWLVLEVILRSTQAFSTHLERLEGRYISIYSHLPNKSLLKRAPDNAYQFISQGEFKYAFRTNSMGYADMEWAIPPADSGIRILALGDSFTEGVGAHQDSGWVGMARLAATNSPVTWYNGGISSSDPFFNYMSLKKELHLLQPDIIVQLISSQDFRDDFPLRGGMERFLPDGSIKYPRHHKAEMIFAYSHVSRLWIHGVMRLNSILVNEEKALAVNENTLELYNSLQEIYGNWADSTGSKVYFVFFPLTFSEIENDKYAAAIINKAIHHPEPEWQVPVIDLMPCYRKIYDEEQSAFQHRWWPVDGHHTPEGYAMMGRCVANYIHPILYANTAND